MVLFVYIFNLEEQRNQMSRLAFKLQVNGRFGNFLCLEDHHVFVVLVWTKIRLSVSIIDLNNS